jgi:hypothetical protein
MNINDILLAQNIKRWTIVSTIQKQSLAEHLFNVAMIARDICVEADIDDTNVVKYALDHDLDEIMTGDIPSPAKARLNIKDDYNGKSKARCAPTELLIVKAADLIDAYLFIKHNHHDRHGKQVFRYMEDKLESFMSDIREVEPWLGNAIDNTMAMLEFGQFDVEQRNE